MRKCTLRFPAFGLIFLLCMKYFYNAYLRVDVLNARTLAPFKFDFLQKEHVLNVTGVSNWLEVFHKYSEFLDAFRSTRPANYASKSLNRIHVNHVSHHVRINISRYVKHYTICLDFNRKRKNNYIWSDFTDTLNSLVSLTDTCTSIWYSKMTQSSLELIAGHWKHI